MLQHDQTYFHQPLLYAPHPWRASQPQPTIPTHFCHDPSPHHPRLLNPKQAFRPSAVQHRLNPRQAFRPPAVQHRLNPKQAFRPQAGQHWLNPKQAFQPPAVQHRLNPKQAFQPPAVQHRLNPKQAFRPLAALRWVQRKATPSQEERGRHVWWARRR